MQANGLVRQKTQETKDCGRQKSKGGHGWERGA